jgi:hypothetical protein
MHQQYLSNYEYNFLNKAWKNHHTKSFEGENAQYNVWKTGGHLFWLIQLQPLQHWNQTVYFYMKSPTVFFFFFRFKHVK